MTTETLEATSADDTNEQILQRKQKLQTLRESAKTAYPNDFRRKDYAKAIQVAHEAKTNEVLETEANEVQLAGRIMARRMMGKASFVHIQDVSGRIQLYLRLNDLPEGVFEEYKSWDLGDIIGAKGVVFKTKTGELSVKAKEVRLLTKALRPLPDKWHGLTDQEVRYRQRYLDLIVNEQARDVFRTRTVILQEIRKFFNARDYLEVETPMMHSIPGGATARPFVTHHNALSMDMFLRVAPELYLKRLIVGGFERVYELNRNFRNEGVSTKHNPEFTMLEFYEAYSDYHDLMDLTEALFKTIAQAVAGSDYISYQGKSINFSKPFARLTVKQSLLDFNEDLTEAVVTDQKRLTDYMTSKGLKVESSWGLGRLQFELFEETVEGKIVEPTFITEHPIEVSPLARRNDENPMVTDRFELFIGGREYANGFSELNDSEDQAERFRKQVAEKEAGDQEAMHYDADYVRALEYGMPPTAGEGIGIDRLVMLFTDSPSIRDVLLFPHMRPEVL